MPTPSHDVHYIKRPFRQFATILVRQEVKRREPKVVFGNKALELIDEARRVTRFGIKVEQVPFGGF
jgi:hypothetical protein